MIDSAQLRLNKAYKLIQLVASKLCKFFIYKNLIFFEIEKY